jgi:hypothetical protein
MLLARYYLLKIRSLILTTDIGKEFNFKKIKKFWLQNLVLMVSTAFLERKEEEVKEIKEEAK